MPKHLNDKRKYHLKECVIKCLDRIYSYFHAVSFSCCPFRHTFRKNAIRICKPSFPETGNGDLNQKYHNTLELLRTRSDNFEALVAEFIEFLVPGAVGLNVMTIYHTCLFWEQLKGKYPCMKKSFLLCLQGSDLAIGC